MTSDAKHKSHGDIVNGWTFKNWAVCYIPGRPVLINAERSKHWRAHRATTAANRAIGKLVANQITAKGHAWPEPARVHSWPQYKTLRSWPDVGNWIPTVKAVIDGFVDAEAWADDNHKHITDLSFSSPELGVSDGLFIAVGPSTADVPTLSRLASMGQS